MTLRAWIKNAEGKPSCPVHLLTPDGGTPVILTYIEQASGERMVERWRCPVDDEEYVQP